MTDKGKILAFPDTAAIDSEAAAWVARFDAGEVSARDQAEFQAWLNRSALHRQAIAEYGSLWSEFDALRVLVEKDAAGQPPAAGTAPRSGVLLKKAAPWLGACAAALVLAAGGAVLLHPQPQQELEQVASIASPPPTKAFYETPVGGHKTVTLADGTTVTLNTNSLLAVNFKDDCRDVHLIRGEAYFEVVHDKARPFTVYANNFAVRDIGTAFDVHLAKAGQVEVGVTRGSVEVAPVHHAAGPAPVKQPDVVVAGQRIVLGPKIEPPQPVSSAVMGRKLAWRQGELIYTGQPLGEVLEDVSRYADIKIELADPALKDLPVGGAFRTDQIGAIFAALENNFGIRAQWIDSRHVRFTASDEKQTASRE